MSTPIGNLKDISERAVEALKDCDLIVCENPKHSLKLLNKLGIKKKLIPLHDYNETLVIKRLAKEFFQKKIVLISDAGSPLISDPGYKFINHCIKKNLKITTVPGPNSIIPALQLSGIPINEFSFFGFFPKTNVAMSNFINKLRESQKTSIFFVSSHKIYDCLNLIEEEIGDRLISVSKELTKINEKVFRGLAHQIKGEMLKTKDNIKGEFVLVVEGNPSKQKAVFEIGKHKKEIRKMLLKFSLTDVVEIVHKLTGINKNNVYKCVLEIKNS